MSEIILIGVFGTACVFAIGYGIAFIIEGIKIIVDDYRFRHGGC